MLGLWRGGAGSWVGSGVGGRLGVVMEGGGGGEEGRGGAHHILQGDQAVEWGFVVYGGEGCGVGVGEGGVWSVLADGCCYRC